jgi:hypothetical protein
VLHQSPSTVIVVYFWIHKTNQKKKYKKKLKKSNKYQWRQHEEGTKNCQRSKYSRLEKLTVQF